MRLSRLCWIFFLFLKDNSQMCCRCFLGLPLLLLPNSLKVFKDTPHTMPRSAKFSTNSSLGIMLLVQKYYYIPVRLCYLLHLSWFQLKECVHDGLLLTRPTDIILNWFFAKLLCLDTIMVDPLS